jgi:hypothetical protein
MTKKKRVPTHMAITDLQWKAWSMPALKAIHTPLEWTALRAWCRSNHFDLDKLRQCLAWLEERGLARTIPQDNTIYWVATSRGRITSRAENGT